MDAGLIKCLLYKIGPTDLCAALAVNTSAAGWVCYLGVDTECAAPPLSSHIHATGLPACPFPTTPFSLRASSPRQARALPLPRNPRNSRSSDRGALSRQVG